MSGKYNVDVEINFAINSIKRGSVKEGIKQLEDILNDYPNDSKCLLVLGRTLLSYKSFDQSYEKKGLSYLNKLINNPYASDNFKNGALLEKGRYFRSVKRMSEAYSTLTKLIGTSYEDDALYQLALVESFLGNIDKSNEFLLSYHGKFDQPVLLERTKIMIANGNYKIAKTNIDKLKNTSQKDKAITEELYLNIKINNFEKALEMFKTLNPLKMGMKIENLNNVKLYLEYMTGKRCLNNETNNYFEQMLSDYNVGRVVNYITYSQTMNKDKLDFKILDNLLDYCSKYIKDKEPFRVEFLDYYLVDTAFGGFSDNVGTVNFRPTHYVKVGTIPNTKKIISLRLVENVDDLRLEFENLQVRNKR